MLWRVWICSAEWMETAAEQHCHICKAKEKLDGLCQRGQHEIWIRVDEPDVMQEVLLHEFCHLFTPDFGELEEPVIAHLSPRLFAAITAANCFRTPRLPAITRLSRTKKVKRVLWFEFDAPEEIE